MALTDCDGTQLTRARPAALSSVQLLRHPCFAPGRSFPRRQDEDNSQDLGTGARPLSV
jgi:hypothetical protein